MVLQLVTSIIITVLCFTAFFMLRYMRKHPPKEWQGKAG